MNKKNQIIDDEAYELSTPEERFAVDTYRYLQQQNGLTEGQLLEASQMIGIIVERNKRLGLCK